MAMTEAVTAHTARAGGLEGVVVADTALSDVDGERGKLVIAGSDVESLAGAITFEGLCTRLWRGMKDTRDEADVRARIAAGRVTGWDALTRLGDALALVDGMDALRAACA